jgi:predicted transcriptional regulator
VADQFLILTAQIVSAQVATNDLAVQRLPEFIRAVYQTLATVGQTVIEPPKADPAVSVKKSIFPDRIVCLDCGGSFKMLKRHISTDHQMKPNEYRTKWGLSHDYPMVAAEYAAARSKLAKDSGLGRKAEAQPPPKKRGRATR